MIRWSYRFSVSEVMSAAYVSVKYGFFRIIFGAERVDDVDGTDFVPITMVANLVDW